MEFLCKCKSAVCIVLVSLLFSTSYSRDVFFSDYVGSSNYDYSNAVASDTQGNIYITGESRITSDLPEAINSISGDRDAYVTKLSAAGQVLWSLYLGGAGRDYGFAIDTDAAGNVYVTGITESLDWPAVTNSYHGGKSDAFVVCLNPAGQVLWTTFVGGNGTDRGLGIALDDAGNIAVAGYTKSNTLEGQLNQMGGGSFDGFLTRLNPAGTILFSNFVGGEYSDSCEDIAVDSSGRIYVTGTSFLSAFPGALNSQLGGDDVFIICYDTDGSVVWSRYLGGSGSDRGYSIAFSRKTDNVIVTGHTVSDDLFDSKNTIFGDSDAFVIACDLEGRQVFALYFGGSGTDTGNSISIDEGGNIIVSGTTNSTDLNGADNSYNDKMEAFIAGFTSGGTLIMSSYFGGREDELGLGTAVDFQGDILVCGSTNSPDFPADTMSLRGDRDAFIAKVDGLVVYQPDLVVSGGTSELDIFTEYEGSFDIEIENIGLNDAVALGPGYFRTSVYISDDPDIDWNTADEVIAEFSLSRLDIEQVHLHTVNFIAPYEHGIYYLRSFVDDFDSVAESLENNNWGRVIAMDVKKAPGKPDLVVIDSSDPLQSAGPGDTVTVKIDIKNKGETEAAAGSEGYFYTRVYLSADPNETWQDLSEPALSYRTAFLDSQAETSNQMEFVVPDVPGTYYLRALVDTEDIIEEEDEDNNFGDIISLTVNPPEPIADLTVTSSSAEPLLYQPGAEVDFFVDIANVGDANALSTDPNIALAVYIANHDGVNWNNVIKTAGRMEFSLLQAGSSMLSSNLKITMPDEPGTYRLRAKVDAANVIAESDESNNWGDVVVLEIGYENVFPDLVVNFEDPNITEVRPGQEVDISVIIENRGNANAVPEGVNYFETVLYTSWDINVDWNNIDIAAGSVKSYFIEPNEVEYGIISFTAPDLQGNLYLRTVTDVENTVEESGEDNWSTTKLLVVQGAHVTNEPPVLDPVGDKNVNEMQELIISLNADDPDGDDINYYAEQLPGGATFYGNAFRWRPQYDQEGQYEVVFYAADDWAADSERITITVANTNRAPVLDQIDDKNVEENQLLEFTVNATDPDGDLLGYSAEDLPEGAEFHDQKFSWTPGFDSAGLYIVRFVVSDGHTMNSKTVADVRITVGNINRLPVADAGQDQDLVDLDNNGEELVYLDASGSTDPDNDIQTYQWTDNLGDSIPYGEQVSVLLSRGAHEITLTVTDAEGSVSTDTVNIRINRPGNNLPVADAGQDQTVYDTDGNGSELVLLDASESSDDGTIVTYMWMENDQLIATQQKLQYEFPLGTHEITLRIFDDDDSSDTDTLTIKVLPAEDIDSPPIFNAVPAKTTVENEILEFKVIATDPDNDPVTIQAVNLPDHAVFDPGTGLVSWKPWYDDAGDHEITFIAHSNDKQAQITVSITVQDSPIKSWYHRWLRKNSLIASDRNVGEIIPLKDKTVSSGQLLIVDLSSGIGNDYIYLVDNLPAGASLKESILMWRPDNNQVGVYQVNVTVSDNNGTWSDSDTFLINVVSSDISDRRNGWIDYLR